MLASFPVLFIWTYLSNYKHSESFERSLVSLSELMIDKIELCWYRSSYISDYCNVLQKGEMDKFLALVSSAGHGRRLGKQEIDRRFIARFYVIDELGQGSVHCIRVIFFKNYEDNVYFSPIQTDSECKRLQRYLAGSSSAKGSNLGFLTPASVREFPN